MDAGEKDMNIQRPLFKNEFNWSTVSIFVGFVIMIAGSGAAWQNMKNGQDTISNDLATHQKISDAERAAMQARVKEIEIEARRIDNINYRLTSVEQFGAGVTASLREMQTAVNDINSEMRVMREILQRMDPNPRIGNARP